MAATCVSYHPTELETQRFWDGELTRDKAVIELPASLPTRLSSTLAWTRDEVEARRSQWQVNLSSEDVAAVDAALTAFEANYDDLSSLSKSTFKLPTELSKRLEQLSDTLYNDIGFQIIHGLDPSRYTAKQRAIVYAGVSSHVAPQRGFTDVKSEGVISHVVNVQGTETGPKSTAPAFSNIPLSFHTDNCEIMAFFYYDTALQGGETILSSSWTAYNELATTRPDVIRTLNEPWVLDSYKSYDLQAPRHTRLVQQTGNPNVPVLFRFSRYPVVGWQRKRNPNLPAVTQAQLEAVNAVHFTLLKNSIQLPTTKGDMLFVNDMALMHARNGFDEGGEKLKRHLVKMYLRDPQKGWDIPEHLEKEWKRIYNDSNRPDGSRVESWPLEHKSGLEELSFVNG